MRVLLINNLSAGMRTASVYDFIRAFVQDGDELVMRVTDSTTPAESFLDDAVTFDAVVVAGGDGTVASVCYALRNTGIPILPYPSGTANLLALNLDSPQEVYALAKMLRVLKTIDFDMGEFDIGDKAVGFSLIAGAGYDANIIESATRLKPSLGVAAYWITALIESNPTLAHFTIKLDDRVVETEGIAVLLINFGKVQFDLSVTHDNNPRDALLEVVVLKPQYTVQLLPALMSAVLDRSGGFPTRTDAVEIYRAREVHVTSDPPLPTQFDGEVTGATTPFSARALPGAIHIIVDENSAYIQQLLQERDLSIPQYVSDEGSIAL
jgi:diacylglycerol kinase family enzyme